MKSMLKILSNEQSPRSVIYVIWKLKKCWIFYEQFLLPQKQNQCKYQKKKMQNTFNKCVKGEWRQFARLVYLGAAPSSGGHLLHHAKTTAEFSNYNICNIMFGQCNVPATRPHCIHNKLLQSKPQKVTLQQHPCRAFFNCGVAEVSSLNLSLE